MIRLSRIGLGTLALAILPLFSVRAAAATSDLQPGFLRLPGAASDVQVNSRRLSVQFDSQAQAESAAQSVGMKFHVYPQISAYKGFACGYFESDVAARGSAQLADKQRAASAMPGARYVGYDFRTRIVDKIPNDPDYSELWGMEKISAPAAWDNLTDASEVIVAIIDSGINYEHQDLKANLWVNSMEIAGNGKDDDNNGYVDDLYGIDVHNKDGDPKDDNGHGSHCAGTIGASGDDGIGIPGVSWKVKMLACKSMGSDGSGADSVVPECLEYIMALKKRGENIVVTSNSWGADGHDPNIQAGFEAMTAERIISACAAGNDSADNDSISNPAYPASYDDPGIVSVMSTDSQDSRSSFSSYGKTTVDLAAPGSSIYSCDHKPNGYSVKSGTSMATPHVAGALALMAAKLRDDDVAVLRDALLSSVDVVGGLSQYCVTGGRLNVAKALEATPEGDDETTSETSTSDESSTDSIGSSESTSSDPSTQDSSTLDTSETDEDSSTADTTDGSQSQTSDSTSVDTSSSTLSGDPASSGDSTGASDESGSTQEKADGSSASCSCRAPAKGDWWTLGLLSLAFGGVSLLRRRR